MEEYLTVMEVGEILGFGKNKMYNIVNQKDFPKIIIGRNILIPKSKFEAFMDKLVYKNYTL